jgi:hypothetical protein
MKGHEIAENLRNSKYRFTTGALHKKTQDGTNEDAFCVMGLKALEAGVSIERLDKTWNCSHIPNAAKIYQINDDAANIAVTHEQFFLLTDLEVEKLRKQAVIDAFDSPQWHNFDFPMEQFIQYLKDTIE